MIGVNLVVYFQNSLWRTCKTTLGDFTFGVYCTKYTLILYKMYTKHRCVNTNFEVTHCSPPPQIGYACFVIHMSCMCMRYTLIKILSIGLISWFKGMWVYTATEGIEFLQIHVDPAEPFSHLPIKNVNSPKSLSEIRSLKSLAVFTNCCAATGLSIPTLT
jgi:hypothetical protein